MNKGDDEFGFFEESDDMEDRDGEIYEVESDRDVESDREVEFRFTHIALRQQLLDKASAFIAVGPNWKIKTLKQRLAELQVAYRVMVSLTEDE